MANVDIADFDGVRTTVRAPNANGRAAAASSAPIALSTEDKTALDAIGTSVDGVETLITSTNTKLDTAIGHVDGIETLITSTNTKLDTTIGHVDGLETLVTSTNTKLDTVNTNLGTIDGRVDGVETLITSTNTKLDTLITSSQLIDDAVQVLGTDTYTEATSKGLTLGAVRRDADTTLVNTTNEFGPLQMDANGRLKVEVFSGETLPVSLTSTAITGTVAVTQSGTWDEIGINDSGNSITVDNGGTFVVQVNGDALTSLQALDDIVYTDDTSTHATGTSKGALFMAAAVPTDTSVSANDIGAVAMTTDRKLHVAVMDALPAGTAAIGKLAANSGVDIGDVDVTTIAGVAPAFNSGAVGATVLRTTQASDSPLVAAAGAIGDSAWASGNGTQIALLKTIATAALDTTTASPVTVRTPCDVIAVTPTIDTAIYASGDSLWGTAAIAGAVRANDERAVLMSIAVIDKDDEKPAMRILFFKANVTFGAANAAPSISDSDAANYLGHVDIAAADYVDLGGVSVACLKGINLLLEAVSGGTTVYMCAYLTAGTPTFTAATDLVLNIGVVHS